MTEDEIVEAMARAACKAAGHDPDQDRGGIPKWKHVATEFRYPLALRIAIPWAREQALREAAGAIKTIKEEYPDMAASMAVGVDWAMGNVLALIPAGPSQETLSPPAQVPRS